MSWLRHDDDMLDHPKWIRALRDGGADALLIWWRLCAWSSRRRDIDARRGVLAGEFQRHHGRAPTAVEAANHVELVLSSGPGPARS